jgi:fluoroacetyl-CoA thioesterase
MVKDAGAAGDRFIPPTGSASTRSPGPGRIGSVPFMKTRPRIGLSGEQAFDVGPSNRISFADGRMPSILATPWLIAYLEYTARDAIAGCLEDHERSVGTFVEVEHLAPAPEGTRVTCRARVIHVDGPIVTFQVDAHDELEPIARGIHRRRVIDVDRFARRVARKREQTGKPAG